MKYYIFLFLSVISIASASTSLPKEFRQWNVRIVGDGYFQYLIPRNPILDQSMTGDGSYSAAYVSGALPEPSDSEMDTARWGHHKDPFELTIEDVTTPATCVSSDGATVNINQNAKVAGNCVSITASCVSSDGNAITVPATAVSAAGTDCNTVNAICKQKVGTTKAAAIAANEVDAPMGTISSDQVVAGNCIETHIITLNNGFTSSPFPQIGEVISQDLGTGGTFRGTISDVNSDFTVYTLNNVQGIVGAAGTLPVEFSEDTLHKISYIQSNNNVITTLLYPTATEVKIRTFTPAVIRTFTAHVLRTFTAAVAVPRNNQIVYSRYGNLHINKFRMLTDPNGLLIVGETKEGHRGFLHIPEFYETVHIAQDGKIHVKYLSGASEFVGKIQVAKFPSKYGLNLYSNDGFEVSCVGANAFGFSLGSWCRGGDLDGKKLWYYVESGNSGHPNVVDPSPWGDGRLQQYHLNTEDEDLFVGGKKPNSKYADDV